MLCHHLISTGQQFPWNNDCLASCRDLLAGDYSETLYSADGQQITTTPHIKVIQEGFLPFASSLEVHMKFMDLLNNGRYETERKGLKSRFEAI